MDIQMIEIKGVVDPAVLARVKKEIGSQLGIRIDEVKDDAHIVNELGADSLDTTELVMSLEDEFGTDVPDEEAEQWTCARDAARWFTANVKAIDEEFRRLKPTATKAKPVKVDPQRVNAERVVTALDSYVEKQNDLRKTSDDLHASNGIVTYDMIWRERQAVDGAREELLMALTALQHKE
jgi:acyl carrier protein